MDSKVIIGISSGGRYVAVSKKHGLIYINKDNFSTKDIVGVLTSNGYTPIEDSVDAKAFALFKLFVVGGCTVNYTKDLPDGIKKYNISILKYQGGYGYVRNMLGYDINISNYTVEKHTLSVNLGTGGGIYSETLKIVA